jgi:cobalt-precorrin-5B (C1)-methyltransferase
VVKDAGDDPDVTDGAMVVTHLAWAAEGDLHFHAGEGVGTITKPGLALVPGEPAINPGPRAMIRAALREVSDRPLHVTVSIPGGVALSQKTFNPRLGIANGLSVLGTTGRVRPFSCQALRCSLVCALDVAKACGVNAPVLVPGHIGERSARRRLRLAAEQIVEVGNEWGFVLPRLKSYAFSRILLWGHAGKLAKLAVGQWDTHSARSAPAVEGVSRLGKALGMTMPEEIATTEGLFAALNPDLRRPLAEALAGEIAREVAVKAEVDAALIHVGVIDLKGDLLGTYGVIDAWR